MLPDELLYSVFCRYSNKIGVNDFKPVSRDLFGTENIVLSWEFPSHINRLVDNMGVHSYSTEEIIFSNTMLPLYYPFLNVDRQRYAIEQMKSDNGKGIHMKLGVMASSVKVSNSLKFCSDCIIDDIKEYGVAYWHRSHNAAGVDVCHKHNMYLRDKCPLCNKIIAPKSKNLFTPLVENCQNGDNLISNSDSCFLRCDDSIHQRIRISKAVAFLLNYTFDGINANSIFERYMFFLKQKELITTKGCVRQNDFIEQFCSYYQDKYLNDLGLGIEKDSEYNWLSDMLRRTRRAYHPLKHILLINFLVEDISEFFGNRPKGYYPFGKGPWLCLNPVVDHYRQPVIKKCEITRCSETKKPVGTFVCSCGFVYSRRGADTSQWDRYKIGRIKAFGHTWENRLIEIVQNQGGSLRSIAKVMKADPMTIKKYIRKLGLDEPWNLSKSVLKGNMCGIIPIAHTRDEICTEYAQRIRKFIAEDNQATRKVIRNNCQKEYTWLYRYNKELLCTILPESNRKHANKERVDWGMRDKEINNKVKDEIQYILSAEKTNRITMSRIGKNLGILPILEQHLGKLPKTKMLLEQSIETVEAFQIRRVVNAINDFKSENIPIKPWKIYRKAGLRENCSDAVKQLIKDCDNSPYIE